MKSQIKILSLVFILLVLGGLIFWGNDSGSAKKTGQRMFNFDQDRVASFQVNNFTVGLKFQKKGNVWQVKRVKNELAKQLEKKAGKKIGQVDREFKYANSVEVAKSLTYLLNLKDLEPISTQAKDPGTYEINDYSLHVILFDKGGQELDRILIGKTGPDPYTSFLKKVNSDDVYLANQDFRLLFFRKYEEWLAKE